MGRQKVREYKALSVWEPWASLIARGKKTIEMRSWSTPHRGPLIICSAKNKSKPVMEAIESYKEAKTIPPFFRPLFGKTLALANLVDCRVLTNEDRDACCMVGAGFDLEDPENKTYGWILEDVKALTPEDVTVEQGLFSVWTSPLKISEKAQALIEAVETLGRYEMINIIQAKMPREFKDFTARNNFQLAKRLVEKGLLEMRQNGCPHSKLTRVCFGLPSFEEPLRIPEAGDWSRTGLISGKSVGWET